MIFQRRWALARTVAVLNLLPWRTPKVVRTTTNSTPPFKFRQTESCEVRSRLAELSVEWTNESFLSVSQRSSSCRFTFSMAIWGKKVLKEFSLGTCFQTKWKLLFHAPHSIASKKTLTWDSAMTFTRKTFCCVWQQQRAKKLGTKQKNLTLPLIVISPKLPLLFVSILEKFRCF